MSQTTINRIKLIYGILLSALLVVSGILLMIACVSIYRIGEEPFTPQNIANAFSKICIPVYITLGSVAAGLIFWIIYPNEQKKPKPSVGERVLLERLAQKLNIDENCPTEPQMIIKKEKKLRLTLRIATLALCVLVSLPGLIYALNLGHYHGAETCNSDIIAACLWLLPCVFVATGLCVALVYLEHASLRRELEAVKRIAKVCGMRRTQEEPAPIAKNDRVILIVRIALAVAAVGLIIAGIANGGMADVLAKAINICTECIGLG